MKKKILLLLLSTIMSISLMACSNAPVDEESDAVSKQLQQDYDFYSESIVVLKDGMELDTEHANTVFEVLISIGLDEEITYCFDKDGYYKVWWGSTNVDVYLTDGIIEKIMDDEKLLYSSTDSSDKREQESEVIVSDLLTCPQFTAEQNTTAMVDQIALTAKEHATNLTDDQATQIISIIREAGHKFYNGPEEMEKFMWYGYLLDYKYDDSDARSQLGTDLCQAIKYVYRGVESVLDDSTHENLLQIDKDLEAIQ